MDSQLLSVDSVSYSKKCSWRYYTVEKVSHVGIIHLLRMHNFLENFLALKAFIKPFEA